MSAKIRYRTGLAVLWRHNNGTYYARHDGGRSSLGTKDEKIAKALLQKFNRDRLSGKVSNIAEKSKTLKPFVEELMAHIQGTIENSTVYLYDVALRKAIRSWGDIPLSHITPRHIDTLVGDMKRDGLSVPTINKNMRHIKSALRKAAEWSYITHNIKFPHQLKAQETLRYLSTEQLRTLIGSIEDQEFQDFCLFAAYTGLRSGEIVRLAWDDVDNPEGFLRITAKQKNKTESRIPISQQARAILDRCKSRGGYKVFRFECRTWISHKFKDAARKVGLDNIREHDLRHTFGSHLAMQGDVSLLSIQQLMRHKSYSSTLVYAKLSPDHLRKEAEKLNYGPMLIKGEK